MSTSALIKPRHEYKHALNAADALVLRSRLRAVLKHDGHVDANGTYTVQSLYFDTSQDKALREKRDGVDCREKFRIRLYNGDLSYIRLEKKSKRRGLSYKEKAPLSALEVSQLIAGQLSWMLDSSRPLVCELSAKMRLQGLAPKVVVSYLREPFVAHPGNVRITLDSQLRTSRYATNLLAAALPTIPAGEGGTLLEVKYDSFIPEWIAGLVRLPARRAGAFSKYAAARMFD